MPDSGKLRLDPWVMTREVLALSVALLAFVYVMADSLVQWWEAALLVAIYVVYALVCVFYPRLLRGLWRLLACCAPSQAAISPELAPPRRPTLRRPAARRPTPRRPAPRRPAPRRPGPQPQAYHRTSRIAHAAPAAPRRRRPPATRAAGWLSRS